MSALPVGAQIHSKADNIEKGGGRGFSLGHVILRTQERSLAELRAGGLRGESCQAQVSTADQMRW